MIAQPPIVTFLLALTLVVNFVTTTIRSNSAGAYVANTNARGQLMLILGTMHNLEVYAIVIQKNDGAIF